MPEEEKNEKKEQMPVFGTVDITYTKIDLLSECREEFLPYQ